MLQWKLRKRHILPVSQNLSSVYFSLAKFQLVSCNLSLAIIWQMTYAHKLPKLCSATLMFSTWSKFSWWMSHLEGFPPAFPRQHLTTSTVFSCTVVSCITGVSFAFLGREKASAKQNFNFNLNFIHSITHPIYNFMIASIRVYKSLIEVGKETQI